VFYEALEQPAPLANGPSIDSCADEEDEAVLTRVGNKILQRVYAVRIHLGMILERARRY
jgi:hypothetical protein